MALNDSRTILLLSADETLISDLVDNLKFAGYRCFHSHSPAETLSILDHETIDVALLDIELIAHQEIDLVNYIKTRFPHQEIIVFSRVEELEEARAAVRNGASFYLVKPVSFTDIRTLLEQIFIRAEQSSEHVELEQKALFDLMAGSPAMQKTLRLSMKIAPTSSTVLLGGESGTGKEFFARIIHRLSNRPSGKFVAMNCGAVPDSLFESELFGHKKGSFTGADRDRPGLVEDAHLGTLFLDEVGELSPMAQVKLLRFLQERTFRRIGDNTVRTANARIIAASNRDLFAAAKNGSFREDLLYRLNVFYLVLPPLRERKETIPTLIKLFVHRYNSLMNKQVNNMSKGAEALLAGYNYPGNVRELENIIEHAVVLAENGIITEKELPESVFSNHLLLSAPAEANTGEFISLADLEKQHIEATLNRCSFNYSETAQKLGISRSTLWRKIKTCRIAVPGEQNAHRLLTKAKHY